MPRIACSWSTHSAKLTTQNKGENKSDSALCSALMLSQLWLRKEMLEEALTILLEKKKSTSTLLFRSWSLSSIITLSCLDNLKAV